MAQMLLIGLHLLPAVPSPQSLGLAWPLPLRLLGLLLLLVGFVLGAQGFLHLGENLSPLPEPLPGSKLVTDRAYSRCRHPLYQAVLICSLGVVLALGSLMHLGLLLALAIVLSFKARREERRLCQLFPSYEAYCACTPAIVPSLPGLDWRSVAAEPASPPP